MPDHSSKTCLFENPLAQWFLSVSIFEITLIAPRPLTKHFFYQITVITEGWQWHAERRRPNPVARQISCAAWARRILKTSFKLPPILYIEQGQQIQDLTHLKKVLYFGKMLCLFETEALHIHVKFYIFKFLLWLMKFGCAERSIPLNKKKWLRSVYCKLF